MTYFGFLLRFIFLPILMLLGIIWWDNRQNRPTPGFNVKHVPAIIAVHILLALIYTTPWDNCLVATDLWSFNSTLVAGMLLGRVHLRNTPSLLLKPYWLACGGGSWPED